MEDIDITKLESKTSTEYDGHKRILYKLQCKHCEKDYWRPKKELAGSNCCGRECYNIWRAKKGKRHTYQCTWCNNDFKRYQHRVEKIESGRIFCSRKCQNEAATHEKGDCLNCNEPLKGKAKKFCSHDCQWESVYKENIGKWQSGELSGMNAAEGFSAWVRRYMIDKAGNKCSKCGWCEVHPKTGKVPLQVDHIDGDYKNNAEDNLRVLCPNCHSLTETFGALNKGKGREKRRLKLQGNKINSEGVDNWE